MGLCHHSMKMDSGRETALFIITDSMVKSLEQTQLYKVVVCDLSQDVFRTELTEFDNWLAMRREKQRRIKVDPSS